MKTNPYHLTADSLSVIRAAAQAMGDRLRELRAQRETAAVLARAALPELPAFDLPAVDPKARDFLADLHASAQRGRFE